MTVSTSTNSVVYRGNGATTQFAVPFKVLDESHLTVIRRSYLTGVLDYTYVGTDYTYSGIGDDAGTLTLAGTALDDDYELVIERIVPYTQDLDIVNAGGFYPETVEEQLDLIVMGVQQVAGLAERSSVVPVGEAGLELTKASDRSGKFFGFDAAGNFVALSGTGSDASLRTDLAAATGADLIGIGAGETLGDYLTSATGATDLIINFRDDPSVDFASLPIKPRAVHGRGIGGVSMSESPLSYAMRTNLVVDDPPLFVDPVYGNDANDGAYVRPKQTLTSAVSYASVGTSWVHCAGGIYEEGLNLTNTGPLANRIRILRALGTCTLRCPRDDLTENDVKATGQIAFGGLPSAGESFTLGGFVFTFRAAIVVPTDVLIGADAAATAVNTAAALNRLSSLTNVTAVVATADVNLTATLYGTLGNAITLTEAATNVTVSGATLTGGVNTWTAGSSNTWSYNLDPANPAPRAVLDMRLAGPDGQGYPLAKYDSLADLQTFIDRNDNMGGWFHDDATDKLWIRRGTVSIEDYRENLRLVTAVAVGTGGVHISRLYMQDVVIAFVGDWRFEGVFLEPRSISGRAKLFLDLDSGGAVNASFSNFGFLETAASHSIIKGVVGHRNAGDTFHYSKSTGPAGGWAMEIDCFDREAGDYQTFGAATPFTTNASSIHDDYLVARFGCDYADSFGIVVADTGTGASMNIACKFRRGGPGNPISFLSEVLTYIDSCDLTDSTTDLQAQNGGEIYVFNTIYLTSATPSGTIQAFMPPTEAPVI